ncbi:MAG: hypothetical protein HOF98_09610 [Gammaproteobacteria bacterium]|jgi:type I restriction enzyme, S subunit|nr:hypothetical protein [Gammaproteobacteria bacterium]
MGERYQAYPEYKDSGVEWLKMIPVSWSTSRLKRLVDQNRQITYGIVQAGPNIENGIPYIRPADMTDENGIKSYENLLRTSKDIAADYDRSKIKSGDIVCSIGPSFGKLMITPESLDGANLTQGTARVAISSENVARYYFWGLRSSSSFRQWESGVGGATFRALNLGPLADTQLAFPSKKEQECIANFLDYETSKIDTLIEKQQQLIKLLKEKRQAVISHAVTKGLNPDAPMKDSGVEWLGEVPEHWGVMQFRRITCLQQGLQIPQENRFAESGQNRAEYITIKSINSGSDRVHKEFIESPSKRVVCSMSDVLLARTGATGEVVTNVTGVFHNNFFKVNYDKYKIAKDYLVYILKVNEIKSHLLMLAGTTTIPDLNHGAFLGTLICLPTLEEQLQICIYLDKELDKYYYLGNQAQKFIELLKERRTALISAAVTGKIDVRNWKSPEQNKTNKEDTL